MSEPKLTEAQKRALHHCSCGHLIESHDGDGCFQTDRDDDLRSCPCAEPFGERMITTTYSAVAAVLAEHTQALRDQVERLGEERDAWHARADVFRAKLGGTVSLRGVPAGSYWADWHETHCAAAEGAVRERARAEAAEAEVERLRALLDGEA